MEFVMKLHPNLRNSKGELVPLSTIKNDLKMALASVRQKLIAYHRAKEKELDEKAKQEELAQEKRNAEPQSPLGSLNSRRPKSYSHSELQFKMGFLVRILKEVAHREEDFYAPVLLEDDERPMLQSKFNVQLLDTVLNSIGMKIVDDPTPTSNDDSGDEVEEGKEKKAKNMPNPQTQNGLTRRPLRANHAWLGFKRKLPLWVYDRLAETLALHLPSG